METIDYRTDEKIMLDVVCPESEQTKYSGSDYDKLLAFLDQHKDQILAQMENDDHPGCDTEFYPMAMTVCMGLTNDRAQDFMAYVAKNREFLLGQMDYETKYAAPPKVDVAGLDELLLRIHDQCPENAYRWLDKINADIMEICKTRCELYLYGSSNRGSNNE